MGSLHDREKRRVAAGDEGGRGAALFTSILATDKSAGVEPCAQLADVLARVQRPPLPRSPNSRRAAGPPRAAESALAQLPAAAVFGGGIEWGHPDRYAGSIGGGASRRCWWRVLGTPRSFMRQREAGRAAARAYSARYTTSRPPTLMHAGRRNPTSTARVKPRRQTTRVRHDRPVSDSAAPVRPCISPTPTPSRGAVPPVS